MPFDLLLLQRVAIDPAIILPARQTEEAGLRFIYFVAVNDDGLLVDLRRYRRLLREPKVRDWCMPNTTAAASALLPHDEEESESEGNDGKWMCGGKDRVEKRTAWALNHTTKSLDF